MTTKQIKTEDAILFVEAKLKEYQSRYDKSKAEYEVYAREQNNKFWNRLFGIKHSIDWWESWDFIYIAGWIQELENIQVELSYDQKHKHPYTNALTKDWYSLFYKWCDTNNIPY